MNYRSMGGDTDGGGESRVPVPASPPRCSGCGEPVGALEAAWLEGADGTLHPSAEPNLDEAARAAAHRLWHAGCVRLPPDDA